jgi:hypothetical protein
MRILSSPGLAVANDETLIQDTCYPAPSQSIQTEVKALFLSVEDTIKVAPNVPLYALKDDELIPLGTPNLAKVGRWLPPRDIGLIGINAHLLPNGKVLLHRLHFVGRSGHVDS